MKELYRKLKKGEKIDAITDFNKPLKRDQDIHIRTTKAYKDYLNLVCNRYGLTQTEVIENSLSKTQIIIHPDADKTVKNMAFLALEIQKLTEAIARTDYLAQTRQLDEAIELIREAAINVKNEIYEKAAQYPGILGTEYREVEDNGHTQNN